MINMAAEIANKDPRTRIVLVYQMTWSTGGDAIVVRDGIKSIKDLEGKTIVVQLDGPHVAYLAKLLAGAGLTMKDVNIKWVTDLVGFDGNTPAAAFYEDDSVDAAMVIIPDALALTSNGTIGTGAEDSVKGATIMLSTKSADKIITDVYGVRADYLESHRAEVQKFVHGLMLSQEKLAEIVGNKTANVGAYQKIITQSADILLDSPTAIADAEGLYADCTFVGFPGNVKFFGDPNNPRSFDNLTNEIQTAFMAAGILGGKISMAHAKWDYELFKSGLKNISGVKVPKFDKAAVAAVVMRKQQQGTLAEGELFNFEVYFQPNQNDFSANLYREAFDKVINLASTYGGALITVEGHSDPLGYLKKQKAGAQQVVLQRTKQSAKNLSFTRANAVRDSVVSFAQSKGITLDLTQFAVIGHGFMSPATGMCGADPCAPKTKQEWLNNMRVTFRIIQVEAEALDFQPL
jgi:outer membrane protein OmpA-like peptidoglycan-associated protein